MPANFLSRHLLHLLILIAFAVIGAVIAEASDPAQDNTPQPPPQPDCAQCHADVVQEWQGSAHGQAYVDPVFQEAWKTQNQEVLCLQCHTTGLNLASGEFDHEGVSCEACHGEKPENHPPAPVVIDPGIEVCVDCHTTTHLEWQLSGHGQQQLACTTCHLPHTQKLRFETAEQLCLNCHDAGTDAPYDSTQFAHTVHTEQSCTDCHWFRPDPEDLAAHLVSGNLFPTGHTAQVETQACITCHSAAGATENVPSDPVESNPGLTSDQPLLEAQVRIEELEAEVDTVKAQAANEASLRVIQGAIIGAALGGIVIFTLMRFRRVASKTRIEPKEE